MTHELTFYARTDGRCQVREYLRRQTKKARGLAGWLLTRLDREGDRLERPITDYVEDGIYELRIVVERNQHRILYFFEADKIVMTNAFLKKTAKIPPPEIERARRARADWRRRESRA